MKKASSPTKSAARQRSEPTRLRAEATGLRFTMTDTPKRSISAAKGQKSKGDMRAVLFLRVPLVNQVRHRAAQFIQLLLAMHHGRTAGAGDGVVFLQEDRLLRANLLAQSAI